MNDMNSTLTDATMIPTPKVAPSEQEQIRFAQHIEVRHDIAPVLDGWIEEEIKRARALRMEKQPRIEKWRQTLAGQRPQPIHRRGASNLSVPLTIWALTGVRARLDQGVWEAKPIINVQPLKGRESPTSASNLTLANSIQKLLTSEMLNPRGLNARNEMSLVEAEIGGLGTSGLKVMVTPDVLRKVGPKAQDTAPRRVVERGHVTWCFISRNDLLWIDGFGTNTQAMPLIGHEYDQTWGDLMAWETMGHYDEGVAERVAAFYSSPKPGRVERPASLRDHRLAEIYMDYDVDGDGLTESVMITWHIDARVRLRTVWNPIPSGRRPILMGNFDLPPDITSGDGQGVCEKCEGVQDEVDMIHNIAIEAGKHAGAHLIVVKEGSRADEEIGGESDEVLPGDVIATPIPDEDVKTVPLGNPDAARELLMVEEMSRQYVTRMLGLDEARLGNLESGKRVSAQVGMTTIREGRVVIRQALGSIRALMTEACYLTIELWKWRPPTQALLTIFTQEEMEALLSSVFGLDTDAVRTQFAIIVNAEDAATAQETRKNELMAVNQFLFTFYERLQGLILALSSPQVPPEAKRAIALVAERMERGVEALLNTIDSIPNPEELLVSVNEMRNLLGSMAAAGAAVDVNGQPNLAATDMGAGVV